MWLKGLVINANSHTPALVNTLCEYHGGYPLLVKLGTESEMQSLCRQEMLHICSNVICLLFHT